MALLNFLRMQISFLAFVIRFTSVYSLLGRTRCARRKWRKEWKCHPSSLLLFNVNVVLLKTWLALTHEPFEIATQHFHGDGRKRIFPKYRNIAQGKQAAMPKGENETNEKREMSQTFWINGRQSIYDRVDFGRFRSQNVPTSLKRTEKQGTLAEKIQLGFNGGQFYSLARVSLEISFNLSALGIPRWDFTNVIIDFSPRGVCWWKILRFNCLTLILTQNNEKYQLNKILHYPLTGA